MAAFDRFPVRMRPVVLPKLWGGDALGRLLGKPGGEKAGESWEVSDRPGFESVVMDGPASGLPFSEYIARMGEHFYGGAVSGTGFPLLVKFIGPSQWLSVQVHPADGSAAEGEAGKAEAWVVIDAPEDGRIVYGVRGGREAFEAALAGGTLRDALGWLPVRAGDVVNIPAGTVHALGPNVTVYEIQQSSDTTYRVYDWDRIDGDTGRPRALHTQQALRVIDWDAGFVRRTGLTLPEAGAARTLLICNRHFALERIDADGTFIDHGPGGFSVWSVASGIGSVRCSDPGRGFDVKAGDSFVVPACATGLHFEGRAALLRGHTTPPAEMRRWLLQRGVSAQELRTIDWR
ncbi:MAG: type I phosphomannose isomerase catalytic subunit [Christensenellales bacterium]